VHQKEASEKENEDRISSQLITNSESKWTLQLAINTRGKT
jgi:hypothetical protein